MAGEHRPHDREVLLDGGRWLCSPIPGAVPAALAAGAVPAVVVTAGELLRGDRRVQATVVPLRRRNQTAVTRDSLWLPVVVRLARSTA
jgi:hypothetical protein